VVLMNFVFTNIEVVTKKLGAWTPDGR